MLERRELTDLYEGRYAQGYMDEWDEAKKRLILEVFEDLRLPAAGEALDFGCGQGVLTEVLQGAQPGWQVYGTDLSARAIELARGRFPAIAFFVSTDPDFAQRKFDLVFTHHVLEHVYDVAETLEEISARSKPASAMLHILPCGNAGSFEHRLCLLRKDGIDPDREGRFFYEDEAHRRRLDTERLTALCARHGYRLDKEYYNRHRDGGIENLTRYWRFTRTLVGFSSAVDPRARRRLTLLVSWLLSIAILRAIAYKYEVTWRRAGKTARDYGLLLAGSIPYLLARPVDRSWKRKARQEWLGHRHERHGSEMFLYFTRSNSSRTPPTTLL